MTTPIERRIARFGIELEMFPRKDDDEENCCNECGGDGYWTREVETVDLFGKVTVDYEDEDCDWCGGSGRIESDNDSQAMADTALSIFAKHGLTKHCGQHAYHCNCGQCDYRRSNSGSTFAAQEDCTVGIEFVSRILSPSDQYVFDNLEQAVPEVWKRTCWRPDGDADCGNHIHVGFTAADGEPRFLRKTITAADETVRTLVGMFPQGFEHLASAGLRRMRSYNSFPRKVEKGYGDAECGNTSLVRLGDQTLEFRLWNTPQDPERIAFHVNASLAMTRWAFARYAGKGPDRRQALLDDVREDRLSEDETASGVISMLDPSFKNIGQHREWLTAALAA